MNDVIWSAFIAGAAALGGSSITYLVTNRGIRAAAVEGTRNRDHDREIHAQDRAFERKADTCVAVATTISWMQDFVVWWNQQIALSNPGTTLIPLPSLGDRVDAAPQPPESYKESMSALARLFLDEPTRMEVNAVIVSFTQYQATVALLHSDIPVPEARDNMTKQATSYGNEVHEHAAAAIELLRVEVERRMN